MGNIVVRRRAVVLHRRVCSAALQEQDQCRGSRAVASIGAHMQAHVAWGAVELYRQWQRQRRFVLLESAVQAGLEIEAQLRPYEVDRKGRQRASGREQIA